MNREASFNFGDMVRIEPLVRVPNIKNDNSQINRRADIKSY